MADLRLQKLWVVHAGERAGDLAPGIRAVPLTQLAVELKPLR